MLNSFKKHRNCLKKKGVPPVGEKMECDGIQPKSSNIKNWRGGRSPIEHTQTIKEECAEK